MSALLAVYDDSLCAGLVALDNFVVVHQLTILKGWLDSFSFWLPQCWGVPIKQLGVFPKFAPCLEHICAGGGSVANMGLVLLYRRGFYITPYNYVTCRKAMSRRIVMTTHGVMCDIRYPRQEEAL